MNTVTIAKRVAIPALIATLGTLALFSDDDDWDSTSAPGYFSEQNWNWDPEIEVTSEYSTGNWDGEMSGNCVGGEST